VSDTAHDKWKALAVLGVAYLMVVLDVSIVNVALNAIQKDLDFSQSNLQWIVSGYALTFGGFLLLGGRMGDLLGRRKVFIAGLISFAIFSLMCGLSNSEGMLITFRVLQGAGGFLWRYDGGQAALEEIGPGLHLVTEGDPFGRGPRGEWLRDRWPMDLAPARLRELLASHGEPARDFPCIHMGEVYGTRSASILRLAPSLAHSELYVADGPPCTAPMEDRTRLLAELAALSPER